MRAFFIFVLGAFLVAGLIAIDNKYFPKKDECADGCFYPETTAVKPKKEIVEIKSKYSLEFTEDSIALTGTVNETMASYFMQRVFSNTDNEIYVFIHSSGGSVFSMNRILNTMRTSNKIFTCVARYAASAAFMIFQHCDNRYVISDSILMSHNAAGGFQGEFPRIKNQLAMWEKIMEKVERYVAKRMRMTYEDYTEEINKEMWFEPSLALARYAADAQVDAYCNEETTNTVIDKKVEECTFFGCTTRKAKMSACPLITEPVEEEEKQKPEEVGDIYEIYQSR